MEIITVENIFTAIITISTTILLIYWGIEREKERYCLEGEKHNWEFDKKQSGTTGDLGFGINAYWEVDYYKCSKCGKTREDRII